MVSSSDLKRLTLDKTRRLCGVQHNCHMLPVVVVHAGLLWTSCKVCGCKKKSRKQWKQFSAVLFCPQSKPCRHRAQRQDAPETPLVAPEQSTCSISRVMNRKDETTLQYSSSRLPKSCKQEVCRKDELAELQTS
jgi:hypothetical protein